jgi:magnesium transporter
MQTTKIHTLLESIRKLTRRGAHQHVRKILEKLHAADVAYIFRYLNESEQLKIFMLIEDTEAASEVLSHLDAPTSVSILTRIERKAAVEILQDMEADDKVNILQDVPEDVKEEILEYLSQSETETIEEMFQYPEDSAGRIMNTAYFALEESVAVSAAIEELRSLRQLLLVPPDTPVRNIMTQDVVSANPETDQEEVARIVERYDLLAVPVTDKENKMLGIVTVDDVIDVIRSEATEDIMKMVGTGDEYHTRSVWRSARMRMPWLLAAFTGGYIGIQFLKMFDATLEKIVALAFFLPIIIAMGGNIGITSMTIVVRGLATGKIEVKELRTVIAKELSVALILGVAYGSFLTALAYLQFGDVTYLGFVVGSSMFVSMLMAAAIGTLMPIVLHLLKIDPAVATGPFVTSTVDSLGILVYLGMATVVLL